jgi:peptide subunit release factor 1 (eRF1)
MVSYADVEKLLTARSDGAPVLSLYLEVPLEERALRELPAKAGDLIAAAPGAPTGAAAERVLAWARREAGRVLDAGARQWLGHGVGIFVGDQANLAEARQLPSGLGELAVFAGRPYVRPLLLAAQRHPVYWVVVVDRRHAWLFSVSPDQIELVAQPTAPGVPSPGYGGWYGLESYRVNERVTALAHQHFEDTAEMLAAVTRRTPGDVFVVGGHAATIPRFLDTLAQEMRDRFAGSFLVDTATMTPAKVRALADPVIATWAAKTEEDLAGRIRQEPPGGLAAIGMPECLAAVRRHAVRSLAVPVQTLVPGFACRACGALGTTRAELNAPESGCTHGGGDAVAVPDLVEEMAVMTIHGGGRVMAVADPPGGVAAFLRFPLAARR